MHGGTITACRISNASCSARGLLRRRCGENSGTGHPLGENHTLSQRGCGGCNSRRFGGGSGLEISAVRPIVRFQRVSGMGGPADTGKRGSPRYREGRKVAGRHFCWCCRVRASNGKLVSCPDTVPFALWCVAHNLDNFEQAMWVTVSGLGDRDTTCAMVGGIVVMYSGVESIPAEWLLAREPIPLHILRRYRSPV